MKDTNKIHILIDMLLQKAPNLNWSSCVPLSVRPNKSKCWTSEQRKVNCRAKQRSTNLGSNDPNSLTAFREGILKAKFGVRPAGCITFFWLVGGKVTGWCFNFLVPISLGYAAVLMQSPSSSWVGLGWGVGLSFFITTQRHVLDGYVYPLRRKKDSFITELLFPGCFTSLSSLLFGTQRRPRRPKPLSTDKKWDVEGLLYAGEPH